MSNNDNKVSKGRKPRSTYSDLEKKMFINIMKTGEGGQFWNQIVKLIVNNKSKGFIQFL